MTEARLQYQIKCKTLIFRWWTEKSYVKRKKEQYTFVIVLILATRDTQFGQDVALVMQTTHAQRWQYPDSVD